MHMFTHPCIHTRTLAGNTHTHTNKYVILIAFHGHSGFVNAPQYYVIRTLSVLSVVSVVYVFFALSSLWREFCLSECWRLCEFCEWSVLRTTNGDSLKQGFCHYITMKTSVDTLLWLRWHQAVKCPCLQEVTYVGFGRFIIESTKHENWKHIVAWIQLWALVDGELLFWFACGQLWS